MRLSQATMSRNMDRFLGAILPKLQKYIHFPVMPDDIEKTTKDFFNATGFPFLIGCIDCFHVSLKQPSADKCNSYLNYKEEYSMKIQLVS